VLASLPADANAGRGGRGAGAPAAFFALPRAGVRFPPPPAGGALKAEARIGAHWRELVEVRAVAPAGNSDSFAHQVSLLPARPSESTKHQTPDTGHWTPNTLRARVTEVPHLLHSVPPPLRAPPPPWPTAHSHAPRPRQELALAPRGGADAADATQRGPAGLRAASLLFAPPGGAGRAANCSLGLVAELAGPVDPSSSSLKVPPRPRRALHSAPEA
jgi:hypothetical protein